MAVTNFFFNEKSRFVTETVLIEFRSFGYRATHGKHQIHIFISKSKLWNKTIRHLSQMFAIARGLLQMEMHMNDINTCKKPSGEWRFLVLGHIWTDWVLRRMFFLWALLLFAQDLTNQWKEGTFAHEFWWYILVCRKMTPKRTMPQMCWNGKFSHFLHTQHFNTVLY